MASVYRKKTGIYYVSVMFQNKRITRSLGTHSYQIARKLVPRAEKQILSELLGSEENQRKHLSFHQLVSEYLAYPNHSWSKSTRDRYRILFDNYLTAGLPHNPTTKAMTIRVINSCNNWGYKHGLISKAVKIEGGSKWESRHRVINSEELQSIFDNMNDKKFNSFVRLAYYTGARSSEIRQISRDNLFPEYLVAYGKTGKRIIKLNRQARRIIKEQNELWNYRRDFVSHKFKKEVRRLGIKDARFHDLRRTFGYNLIKQGRPIYEVSKVAWAFISNYYRKTLCSTTDY